MQVISLSTGFVGNGVREQYSGEGALRWPSERATEVEFMTILLLLLYLGSNKSRLGEQKRVL